MSLNQAAELVWDAVAMAHVVGDHEQADRLEALARLLEHEAEYARGVDGGGPRVRRRRSGRSLGWLLRHDAAVRALRRARGLSVPDLPLGTCLPGGLPVEVAA
jgi:hypothetical protein